MTRTVATGPGSMPGTVLDDRMSLHRSGTVPRLDARRLRKVHGGTVALGDGNITLAAGEIHALLGGPGAGKSTMIRCLAGVEHADHGRVLLDGLPLADHARGRSTIAFVDAQIGPAGATRRRRTAAAIARAVRERATVLLLDEPTADLEATEVGPLFTLLRRVRDAGTAVLLVSHRLDDVFDLCDRATVLRNGDTIGTYRLAALPRRYLLGMITGEPVA